MPAALLASDFFKHEKSAYTQAPSLRAEAVSTRNSPTTDDKSGVHISYRLGILQTE